MTIPISILAADNVITDISINRDENDYREHDDNKTSLIIDYRDCPLIEIVHLHDCLRNALKSLNNDIINIITKYPPTVQDNQDRTTTEPDEGVGSGVGSSQSSSLTDMSVEGQRSRSLEMHQMHEAFLSVSARFKVLWSVFQTHSKAEDDYIWPKLQSKLGDDVSVGSHGITNKGERENKKVGRLGINEEDYEEDHEEEERMFQFTNQVLRELRQTLTFAISSRPTNMTPLRELWSSLGRKCSDLEEHLREHLVKEEKECMPVIMEHLTKEEMEELVGDIMGTRSAEQMREILSLVVKELPEHEQKDMREHMKGAMRGTFFEKWLMMDGGGGFVDSEWNMEKQTATPTIGVTRKKEGGKEGEEKGEEKGANRVRKESSASSCMGMVITSGPGGDAVSDSSSLPPQPLDSPELEAKTTTSATSTSKEGQPICDNCRDIGGCPSHNPAITEGEIERVIRSVAGDKTLTEVERNSTIQTLRNSVWNNKQRQLREEAEEEAKDSGGGGKKGRKRKLEEAAAGEASISTAATTTTSLTGKLTNVCAAVPSQPFQIKKSMRQTRRNVTPAKYYVKNERGEIVLYTGDDLPLFTEEELVPTYQNESAKTLGCKHYKRRCKLRHPVSGRLYTCRLCCDQDRNTVGKERDLPLDRYLVREVLCMSCGALQPSSGTCANASCESRASGFSRYHCRICNLFDDEAGKNIYHCQYCNVCRVGQQLGIDYRHCMRCNACVKIKPGKKGKGFKDHKCIPQTLQGTCPVCTDSMFESTQRLRRLACGHVMHLECFKLYQNNMKSNGTLITCPLCKKSVEDYKDYFTLLDKAIAETKMPEGFQNARAKVYCQDCQGYSECKYHSFGLKCVKCGSYNTRELERLGIQLEGQAGEMASPR